MGSIKLYCVQETICFEDEVLPLNGSWLPFRCLEYYFYHSSESSKEKLLIYLKMHLHFVDLLVKLEEADLFSHMELCKLPFLQDD